MPLPVVPAIIGMLRAGFAGAIRLAATRGAAAGLAVRQGSVSGASLGKRAIQYTVNRGAEAAIQRVTQGRSVTGTGQAEANSPRQSLFQQARQYATNAGDRIRNITHSQVNNQQTHNNNSVNDSFNQQGGADSGEANLQLPENNSQARVAEDSPRTLQSLVTAASVATIGLASLAYGTVKAVNALHSWGEGLSERQRYLERYNGQIAASFAQLEVARIGRNVTRGFETSASTKFLNTQLSKLEENLLPFQTATTNLFNNTAGTILDKTNQIIDHAEVVLAAANVLLVKWGIIQKETEEERLKREVQQEIERLKLIHQSAIKQMWEVSKDDKRPRRATPPGGF